MNEILQIARQVRNTAYYDGCRAYGMCHDLSVKLMQELRKYDYPCKLIQGYFAPKIIEGGYEFHCWVELYDFFIDITANQFFEIKEDILIGEYKDYPQYLTYGETNEEFIYRRYT